MADRVSKAVLLLVALAGWTVAARADTPSLSSIEAHNLAKRGRLLLIDVRSPVEWRRTGVPAGAVTVDKDLPLDQMIVTIDRLTRNNKNRRLGIICSVGVKSAEVRANLEVAGYRRVIDISDGVDGNAKGHGWISSGLPVKVWREK